MKKTTLICLICLFGFLPFATIVSAYDLVSVNDVIKVYNDLGDDPGGAFKVDNVTKNVTNAFKTYCVETAETFNFGEALTVAGLTTKTQQTGTNLNTQAAYLYAKAVDGTLTGYSFNATDNTALQQAIWYAMGLKTWAQINAKAQGYWNTANTNADGSLYGVLVMNLKKANGADAQDMLVKVPEAGTLLMLGFGMLGSFLLRKRQNQG